MEISRRQLTLWFLAAILGLLALSWGVHWGRELDRQVRTSFLMGDPGTGARLFDSKGCANCHPLFGQGRGEAPDLGLILNRPATLNVVVCEMWNHAPGMWASLQQRKVEYVDIRSQEMADIFAFLYLIRYVDQPGDVDRGELLFEEKGCLACHAVAGNGGKIGPDITTPSFADTPITWVRALWNHAARVGPGQQGSSAQAKLEGDDVSDLLAFVRSRGTGTRGDSKLFPADLNHGEQVFKRQGCANCHTHGLQIRAAGLSPQSNWRWPRSVPELAVVLWNHAPQLGLPRKSNPSLAPALENKDAADLIAYLYALRSLDPPGDQTHGEEIYVAKMCVVCHGTDASGTADAPNLRALRGQFTPIFLAETLWRHGPKIYEQMSKRGIRWPTMDVREMNDLLAFLNSK